MAGAMVSFFAARTIASSGLMNANPVLTILCCSSWRVRVDRDRDPPGTRRLSPLRIGAPPGAPDHRDRGVVVPAELLPRLLRAPRTGVSDVPARLDKTVDGARVAGPQYPNCSRSLVGVVSVVFLTWFVRSTKLGRSMRAVAEDREIAALMGIDVDRVIVWTFAVGGIFAGVAAVLLRHSSSPCSPRWGSSSGSRRSLRQWSAGSAVSRAPRSAGS